jgi:putative glycosyltransferase (TIGR04372 family)
LKIKKKFLIKLILFIPFYISIFFIITLKKIFHIRFCEIETRAVGHYSLPIEIYLSEKDMGIHDSKHKTYDFFIQNDKVANQFLLEKWREHFTILPHYFIPYWNFFRKYRFGKEFLIPYRHWSDYSNIWPDIQDQFRDIYDVLPKTTNHIKFNNQEVKKGEKFFTSNNIKKKIVIFFARDFKFYENKPKSFLSDIRNSRIEDQSKAIKSMSKKYFCLRMGSNPLRELKINESNFLDYSFSEYNNEFNDLYILSKSFFVVSTGSGFDDMATMLRKPVVYVNAAEMEYRYKPLYNHYIKLFIPKKIFSNERNRLLTFSEIYDIGYENLLKSEDYIKKNLSLVNNTKEEIEDVVVEMEQRLCGSWKESKESEDLQKKYWEINSFKNMPKFQCKIGTKFLMDNIDLLK